MLLWYEIWMKNISKSLWISFDMEKLFRINVISHRMRYLLNDFSPAFHTAVPLYKILLATKDGQAHEKLTQRSGNGCHTDRWVQIEAAKTSIYVGLTQDLHLSKKKEKIITSAFTIVNKKLCFNFWNYLFLNGKRCEMRNGKLFSG